MKKAIVLSAVLILASGPSFAAGFPSKHACEFRTHGPCVQEGKEWVASPAASTTAAKPATTEAPATTTTTVTPTTTVTAAPTPPTPPAPPAVVNNQAAPAATSGKGWWPFNGGSNSSAGRKSAPSAPSEAPKPPKPADPRQVARGKVYGSQGDCQGQTAGNCVETDCKTHVGGVCEGNKGMVWTYAH